MSISNYKTWIGNYMQGTMGKFWQVQTVNSNEHLNFWSIICSLNMFLLYQRLVISSAYNQQRNEFWKSRTVLYQHFNIMRLFFTLVFFALKFKFMKERKGCKGWRMVRKKLQSFFSHSVKYFRSNWRLCSVLLCRWEEYGIHSAFCPQK